MNFHLNMACRDGFVTYTTVCKQYSSMVPGSFLSRLGPFFFVNFLCIFGLCSRSCRSFSISFCPVGDLFMRIHIFKARASENFVVKSLNGLKVGHMVMKFQNFHKNHEFAEIP